jgi:1-pyrroline-5-carboxylate dehydrogenase
MHRNWKKTDVLEKMKSQATKRNLKDLSAGPILTWNNKQIKEH